MLYEFAHIVKEHFSILWNLAEKMNSSLFVLRYANKLKGVNHVLSSVSDEYILRVAEDTDIAALVSFFAKQPSDSFLFFNPHGFDESSIRKVVKDKAFQTFLVEDDEQIIGYFFLRSSFNGKCYRGRMIDAQHKGKGLGKLMARALECVAVYEELRMFASISPENYASLNSVKAVSDVKIIKTLDNGYYYVEVRPKQID